MTHVLKYGIGYDLIATEENFRRAQIWHRCLVLGIRCHTCQRISYHPQDVTNRYCGSCKVFHETNLLSHEA